MPSTSDSLQPYLLSNFDLVTRVVHVDRRERQQALLLQLVEPVDAGRRLLGHAADRLALPGEETGRSRQPLLDLRKKDLFFFAAGLRQHVLAGFRARADQDVHGGVAAVVEDHVRRAAVGPLEDLVCVVPVFLERFALDGEDRDAGLGDCRRGMILRREDVAGGPADFGAERLQRLDQNRRLDRHVQRTGNARALQRLLLAELLAAGHQAWHLGLGDLNFLAAPAGKRQVGDFKILGHLMLRIFDFGPARFG